jgi:hypothetical protein
MEFDSHPTYYALYLLTILITIQFKAIMVLHVKLDAYL